jgi:hypothetical protein
MLKSLPPITGASERQVAYATEVRARRLDEIDGAIADDIRRSGGELRAHRRALRDIVREWALTHTEARWWLDTPSYVAILQQAGAAMPDLADRARARAPEYDYSGREWYAQSTGPTGLTSVVRVYEDPRGLLGGSTYYLDVALEIASRGRGQLTEWVVRERASSRDLPAPAREILDESEG